MLQKPNKFPLPKKNFLAVSLYILVLASLGPAIILLNQPSSNNAQSASTFWSRWQQESEQPIGQPQVGRRLSSGERILITADNNPDKQSAARAFADGDYQTAEVLYERSLQAQRNDPETTIYRSNAQAAQTPNPIELGVSVPIGGNLSVAKEILQGVAQAQLEVNEQGGVNNHQVLIHIANDDNDPDIAQQVASEFVESERVVAAIAHNSSKATIAAAPIYNNGELVVISPTSTATELSSSGDYVFRTAPSTRVTASALAHHAVETERRSNIAICSDASDQASQSFKEEFIWAVAELGASVTSSQCNFSADDFDPAAVPSQVTSDGADALLLAPSLYSIDHALDIAQANQGRLSLLGNQTLHTFASLHRGNSDVNGMVLAVAWHPNAIEHPEYHSQAEALWGSPGSWRTASAYDATHTALHGLKNGQSRQDLQQILTNSGFSFDGATGSVEFLSTGDRSMKGVLVEVRPGDRSGTGYDFTPIDSLESLDNDEPVLGAVVN